MDKVDGLDQKGWKFVREKNKMMSSFFWATPKADLMISSLKTNYISLPYVIINM